MDIKKYLPSIITAAAGIFIIIIIPSQIDLSRVRSGNITGVNSRVIPYILSISIVVLSILEILVKTLKNKKNDFLKTNQIKPDYNAFVRVVVTGVLILLWILLMPVLGFVVSMFILMVSIMIMMGNRRWIMMVSTSLITSIALRYVFTNFIGRSLPLGLFF